MDTEEFESEEEGDEQAENQKRGEEEILEVEDVTGSGDEEETGEDVEGQEGSKAGEDKEDGPGDVENDAGGKGELVEEEGKTMKTGEVEGDLEGKTGERDEEITDEEVENREQEEERETEIVLLDDVITNEQGTPIDERETRRKYRQNKKLEEEALVSGARRLLLSDTEDIGDADPQAQETLVAGKNISPEALETRYEAERKRKGKHAAKPHKKKPRQASTAVVINEATPETIRVPFANLTEEEKEQEERDEEPKNLQTEEGVYEKMEVLVTKRLLEARVQFGDPKLQQACDGRAANGKLVKSGKSLCL